MADGVSAANVATPWLNFLNGTNTGTAPSQLWVQLHTASPGAAGATATSVGNATRKQVTLTTSAAGSAVSLTGTNPSWTNGGTSETLTDVSVWSASSGGTFLWSVPLSSSQAWVSTNTFTLTTLSVSVSPQAV